jgi:hypothetical protein
VGSVNSLHTSLASMALKFLFPYPAPLSFFIVGLSRAVFCAAYPVQFVNWFSLYFLPDLSLARIVPFVNLFVCFIFVPCGFYS